ncbi:MAG: alpha/beta fold hydrolase [Propionibacteriaceae bacterium]
MNTPGPTTSHDWIEQPEGRLRVTRAGEGGDPVVLLSGGGMDNAHLSWARLLPVLAADRAVYALDWPKQGGSQPWDGVADHDRLVGCVEALLDHYGLATVDLVGISQGGAAGLATAIARPDRVRRLVAMAPGGVIDFPPGVHQLLWLAAKQPRVGAAFASLLYRSRRLAEWSIRSTLFAGPVDDFDEIVDEVLDLWRTGHSGVSDWQITSINFRRMNVDLRPLLHTITCPTLFIQGDKDVGVRPKFTRAAAAQVPGARLEMISDAGHWVNRQDPEQVNRLVRDFLA